MKNFKIIFAALTCTLMLCSCGRDNKTQVTPSPEPTLAVTDSPTATADAANEGTDGSVMDDMGNMVEDAGNAVGDAAQDMGNAVNDMVGDGKDK